MYELALCTVTRDWEHEFIRKVIIVVIVKRARGPLLQPGAIPCQLLEREQTSPLTLLFRFESYIYLLYIYIYIYAFFKTENKTWTSYPKWYITPASNLDQPSTCNTLGIFLLSPACDWRHLWFSQKCSKQKHKHFKLCNNQELQKQHPY